MKNLKMLGIAGLVAGLLLPAFTASAATFTVTKTDDTADGTCDSDCSLREAVIASNASGGEDEIVLPAGIYQFTLVTPGATDEDLSATGDLDITDSVAIVGAGADATIIDGNGQVTGDLGGAGDGERVFHVNPSSGPDTGAALTLQGVTVRGGRVQGNGGGISVDESGFLGLVNAVVSGNTTLSGSDGGGVYIEDHGALVVTGSKISDNVSDSDGGGVYSSSNGNILISAESEVSDNEATGGIGGGIYVYGGSLEISDSKITGNTSDSDGGGVYNDYTAGVLKNSEISGNKALSGVGGGVYNAYTLLIDNCVVAENEALGDNEGGGIYNDDFTHVRNSTIRDNRSEDDGGGIYNDGYYLLVENSTVTGNSSDVDGDSGGSCNGEGGGGIYNDYLLILSKSVVSGNTAVTCNGGGVFMSDNTIIEDSIISDNTASNGNGGGLYNDCDILLVRDSTFSGNKAKGEDNDSIGTDGDDAEGGGVWSYCAGDFYNVTIVGNEADGDGGGLYDADDVIGLNNVTVAFNTADANAGGLSGGNGGGIFVEDNTVTLLNSIVAGNIDNSAGAEAPDCGATDPSDPANSIVSGGVNIIQNPTGCEVSGDSAAILNEDPLLESDLAENAGAQAGSPDSREVIKTIALKSGSPAIDGGNDASCRPEDARGVARPQDGNEDGTARCDLGALEVQSGEAPGTTGGDTTGGDTTGGDTSGTTGGDDSGGGCSMTDGGSAPSLGWLMAFGIGLAGLLILRKGNGMKRASKLSVMAIALSMFVGGASSAATTWHVTDLGDATPPTAGQLRFILTNGALANGDVIVFDVDGSILLTAGNGNLEVKKSVTIQGNGSANTIIDGQSAIQVFEIDPDQDGIAVTMTGLTIQNGSSATNGGGIHVNGQDSVTLDGCIVTNNVVTGASQRGGGIDVSEQGGILIVNNSEITNNQLTGAGSDGGGISNYYGTLILRNSLVENNSATRDGGGIYVDDGSTEIIDSHITNNTSDSDTDGSGNGGGFMNDYSAVTITGTGDGSLCLIDLNKSNDDHGGGVYNNYSMIIENCTVSGNKALGDNDGGGIYNDSDGVLQINAGAISKNEATGEGGGIYNEGFLQITDSSVTENTGDSDSAGTSGGGGGIYNDYTMALLNTTVSKNVSNSGDGGGIYQNDYATYDGLTLSENEAVTGDGGGMYNNYPVVIQNSAIFKNKATAGDGGGIYSNDQFNIANSTIANNEAGTDGGGFYNSSSYSGGLNNVTVAFNTAGGQGGGIFVDESVLLSNSIIAKNTATGGGPDCFNDLSSGTALISGGANIIDDKTDCDIQGAAIAVSDEDPLLVGTEPVDNGGKTFTIAIGEDSPAFNTGANETCASVDQRGVVRPQGDNCDLGAFELEVSGGDTTGGDTTGGDTTGGDTTGGTTGGEDSGGGCSLIR